jgi:hypothetical protein
MRHALDTGRLAAAAIGEGLRRGWAYAEMKQRYDRARLRRWRSRRRLASAARALLCHPRIATPGVRFGAAWFLRRLWSEAP